jgi:hypothetical protein
MSTGQSELEQQLQQVLGGPSAQVAEGDVNAQLDSLLGPVPGQAPPDEERGEFGKGLTRGVAQTKATLLGGSGVFADLLGFDEFAQNRYADYQQIMQDVELSSKPAIGRVEDIEDIGDFVQWAAGITGEQVPFIAGALVSGGVGGTAGWLSQHALRKGIQGVSKQAIEAAAKKAISRSAAAGIYEYTSLSGAGEVAGEALEAGLEVDPVIAAGSGAIIGALEQLPITTLLKSFGRFGGFTFEVMGRIMALPRTKRALVMAGIISGQEAGTEALQAVVEESARTLVDKEYEYFGEEGESRVLNALAAGAVGGAVFGGAGGVLSSRRESTQGRKNETLLERIGRERQEALAKEAETSESEGADLGERPGGPPEGSYDRLVNPLPDIRTPRTLVEEYGIPAVSVEQEISDDVESLENVTRATTPGEIKALPAPKSQFSRINYRQGVDSPVILIGERNEVPDPLEGLRTHLPDAASYTPADMALRFQLQVEDQAARETAVRQIRALAREVEQQRITEGEARAKAIRVIRQSKGRKKSRLRAEERGFAVTRKNKTPVARAIIQERSVEQESGPPIVERRRVQEEAYQSPETPPVSENAALPAQEQSRLERLMEKEATEGLSQREYGVLERLLSKQEELATDRESQNLQDLEQLFQDENGDWLRQAIASEVEVETLTPKVALRRQQLAFEELNKAAESLPTLAGRMGETGNLIVIAYSPKLNSLIARPHGTTSLGTQQPSSEFRMGIAELPEFLSAFSMDPDVANAVTNSLLYNGERASGLVHPLARNVVFVNTDRARTAAGLQKTLLHEMVVHSGLGALFNRSEITQVLNQMARIFNFDVIAKHYDDLDIGRFQDHRDMSLLTRDQQRNVRILVEEGFARLAEENPRTSKFGLIWVRIRQMVRRLFPRLKISQTEMRYIVEQTAIALREPIFAKNRYRGQVFPYITHLSTETAAFKSKFAKSKMVDASGKPMLFYHSTNKLDAEGAEVGRPFDVLKPGYWTKVISTARDPLVSEPYSMRRAIEDGEGPYEGAFMYPVYVVSENPMDYQNPAHIRKFMIAYKNWIREARGLSDAELQPDSPALELARRRAEGGEFAVLENPDVLEAAGFDGVWTLEGGRNFHVWDSSQIIFALDVKPGAERMTKSQQFVHARADGPAKMVSDALLRVEYGQDEFGRDLSENGANAVADIQTLQGIWNVRGMKVFLTPQQIAKRVKLAPIRKYIDAVEAWWNTRISTIQKGSELVEKWRSLGKGEAQKLAKALFEISTESDELGRKLNRQEIEARLGKLNLEPATRELYHQVDASMGDLLDRLQAGLERNTVWELVTENPDAAVRAYAEASAKGETAIEQFYAGLANGAAVRVRINEIRQEFDKMRYRNYFPRSRFGRYALTGIALEDTEVEGRSVQRGKLGFFATFENVKEQRAALEKFRNEYPSLKWERGKLADKEFAFLGLPPSLMKTLEDKLDLSSAQKEALKEIWIQLGPGRGFMRHMTQRKGIAGYSEDAMRTYANYVLNAAGHLARVEHHVPLTQPLADMNSLAKLRDPETGAALPASDGDGTVVGELRDYLQSHYEYIMSPQNDLAQVRALGFLWYLGANPRSAAVNMTQVPMVTYPWLADRFGDGKAVSAITRAYADVTRSIRNIKSGALESDLVEAIARGMGDGFLDESLAVDLAGIADNPTIERIVPTNAATRLLNTVSYYGSWMFHKAEVYNRRVAFVAAYRLAKEKGAGADAAYQTAKDAVQSTQFEYAKWNRAAFMRGKKSVFFLFWNYVQQASYLAFGGEGLGTAARFWGMLLVLAGMQGLPFSDDLMELYDFLMTKAKKSMGVADPRTAIKEDIRNLAADLGANPDIVMHGLGRYYGLGPMHLLSAFGVPVANTDISASLGLGRVLPGFEDLIGRESDPEKRLARVAVEAGGPVVGMGYNFWRLAFEESPDDWKKWERALPSSMKNLAKALRFYNRGKEQLTAGATLVSFENRPERASLIAAQALGFGPTEVAKAYELRFAQREAMMFYRIRRDNLLRDLGWAAVNKDREGMADARKAITRYNREVEDKRLVISSDEIQKSLQQKVRRLRLNEVGLPNETRYRQLYHEIARGF